MKDPSVLSLWVFSFVCFANELIVCLIASLVFFFTVSFFRCFTHSPLHLSGLIASLIRLYTWAGSLLRSSPSGFLVASLIRCVSDIAWLLCSSSLAALPLYLQPPGKWNSCLIELGLFSCLSDSFLEVKRITFLSSLSYLFLNKDRSQSSFLCLELLSGGKAIQLPEPSLSLSSPSLLTYSTFPDSITFPEPS